MCTRKLATFTLLVASIAAASVFWSSNSGFTPTAHPASSDPPRHFGWIDDPDAVRECVAAMDCRPFRTTAAFAAPWEGPDDVFLWDAARQATGAVLPPRDQKAVGACVGFATASAIEYLLCAQITNGAEEAYRDLAQEIIYGGSRVEIGGGRVRGDGSVGAWAAKWVKDYGVVARGIHGRYDLRLYDEARCRAFGRKGVPTELEQLAREHPVRGVARVQSWEECRAAIRNHYPVVVCSSQGFTMERDADGFCNPKGTWYHAMAVIGVRGGDRPGGFLLNSWGPDAHSGPRYPENAPACGFWADAAVLDRMLKQGDSWSFSEAVGFPPIGQ
jgi:hypothetical protein